MTDHLQWCVECGNVVRSSTEDPKPGDCPACGAGGAADDPDYPFTRFEGADPGGSVDASASTGAESTDDGGKDLDAVYRDRNLLACALVESIGKGMMGGWTPAADADSDEWAVVWLELPTGQVSWHVPRDLAESLVTRNDEYEYDGHSREAKNDILASWVDEGCPT